ncbi:hypothetical protein LCGC14_1953200 [marine sediment metagenome]|uniref:Uncharacterized protein n=1 Tax=marine sediment metagenome TaxID=412755 RepID=A0A0F9HV70_9ZZZZ
MNSDIWIPGVFPHGGGFMHFVTPPEIHFVIEQYREQMRILWQGYGLHDASGREVTEITAPVSWDGYYYVRDYANMTMRVEP